MTFYDWRNLFDEIFQDYPHAWKLNYVHRNDINRIQSLQNHCKISREQTAFFKCKHCSNFWQSAKAQVVFYYPNINQPLGKITMQIFGQQCRKCKRKNVSYADPIFERNTIVKILEKLYEKIGWICYSRPQPSKNKNENDPKDFDNLYDARGEHESHLCEACKLAICTSRRKVHH